MRSTSPAYAVPFWVDRDHAPHIVRIVNLGEEVLRGIRVTLVGSGHLVPIAATTLSPGRGLQLTFIGAESSDSVAVIRWFRPDGDEYLWRFSF